MSAPVALRRIARSRLLHVALAGSMMVIALAGAVGAVQGWRTSANEQSVQVIYANLRWSAAREQTRLRAAAKSSRPKARARFFASARHTATLLARLSSSAPTADFARVLRIETRHDAALAAAASALAGRIGRAGSLRRAVALLQDVEAQGIAGQTSWGATRPAAWPATTVERAEAGDMALVLLIGLLTVGHALRRSAGLEREQDRHEHSELESLRRAAHSDTLTGLANRRAFEDDLAGLIRERNESGTPFSLIAVDLNELKQVNDEHGHEAGDAYICAAAVALSEEIGSAGIVYRTGGDEFMALLPGTRGWHARALAHDVQRRASDATGRRALSIGITESTKTESRRELLHEADTALYEAKRARLLAVTYHAGLQPQAADDGGSAPNEHQKALAAALARAVDTKDAGARHHSESVSELCVAIATRLGVTGHRLERIRLAGLVHDVGKIGVSDAILQKLAPLTAGERSELEVHVTVGHSILSSAELHDEALWVLHHHERFDGSGYPSGLAGAEIPLESRIIAVADAFEAMTGARPYRETMTPDGALAELARHGGTQFDPECVQALANAFGEVSDPNQRMRPGEEQPVVPLRVDKRAS